MRIAPQFKRQPNGSLRVFIPETREYSKAFRLKHPDHRRFFDELVEYSTPIPALELAGWDKAMCSGNPNPYRITAALDLLMLEGPEVDEALGVQEPTVDMWESGEIVPTTEEVGRLAKLTGFPPRFFYLGTPDIGNGFICGDDGCQFISPPEDRMKKPRLQSVCKECGCSCKGQL